LRIAVKYKPVNIGDGSRGALFRPHKGLTPLAHWFRREKYSHEKVIEGIKNPTTVAAVFNNKEAVEAFVEETIAVMDACRPTAVTAMCGVRVFPETPFARTLLARGEVPSVETLYEPYFYFAPGVREGLAETIAQAASARGNWLLPGNKVNDEEGLFATLRGRGLRGAFDKIPEPRSGRGPGSHEKSEHRGVARRQLGRVQIPALVIASHERVRHIVEVPLPRAMH
jgi:hypothetical protein